ncbi:MAG: hypothetical protein ACLQVM_18145, partial [Terriglobia bacterium]
GGEWVVFPRACALGYNLPPLTGLRKGHPHVEDFNCELLTQDTSWGRRFLKSLQNCQTTQKGHTASP